MARSKEKERERDTHTHSEYETRKARACNENRPETRHEKSISRIFRKNGDAVERRFTWVHKLNSGNLLIPSSFFLQVVDLVVLSVKLCFPFIFNDDDFVL